MTPVVSIVEQAQFLGQHRSRADEGHVPADDVEDLRHLVDAPPAQDSAERRDARVGLVTLEDLRIGQADDLVSIFVGSHVHRPELRHRDHLATTPHALLRVQDRAATRREGPDRSDDHERQEHDQQDAAEDDVQRSLDRTLGAGQVWLVQVEQGEVGCHAHGDAGSGDVADVRCDEKVHARTFQTPGEPLDDSLTEGRGTGDGDGVGVLETDASHDLVEPQVQLSFRSLECWLLDDVHDCEAGHRIAIEHVHDVHLRGSRTDDDGAVQEVPVHAFATQPRSQDPSNGQQ